MAANDGVYATGASHSLSNVIYDRHYQYDAASNIVGIDDGVLPEASQHFEYDGLNRLRNVNVSDQGAAATISQAMVYDSYGNIKSKSDLGTYSYGQIQSCGGTVGTAAGPHAVTSVALSSGGTEHYCYDRNGNVIADTSAGGDRAFSYASFDKPTQISKGSHTTEFAYGPSRSRFLRIDSNSAEEELNKTTVYVGSFEKIIHHDNKIEFKRMIGDGVLITDEYSPANVLLASKTQYLIKDYLGSTELVLGEDIANPVVADLSFDAWGKRRDSQSYAVLDASQRLALLLGEVENTTNRGFTGHEMVDEVGIIHMNGRIYDPRLARFLQADPFIQLASDAQMYNRYSYARNSPLVHTDPSGYFLPLVVGLIAYASTATAAWTAFFVGLAAFAQTLHYGGDFGDALRAGVIAGVSAYAFASVGGGEWAQTATTLQKVAAFGSIGGITSVIQGGKFGHGFVSAGLGSAVGGALAGTKLGTALSRVNGSEHLVAAVVGGTASDLTGGKFANGAATAAFASIVSSEIETYRENNDHGGSDLRPDRATAEKRIAELEKEGVLSSDMTFGSTDEAAAYWAEHTYDITAKQHIELGTVINENPNGSFSFGKVHYGKICDNGLHCIRINEPGEIAIHNHPSGSSVASRADRRAINYGGNFAPRSGSYIVGGQRNIRSCRVACALNLPGEGFDGRRLNFDHSP